jgi:hypothetical protein
VLVLNMIEILPPLGKYKYDTWKILTVKCYIDNSMRLRPRRGSEHARWTGSAEPDSKKDSK